MPNWCNNRIVITGPKNKLEVLEKAVNEGELLEAMYPMPKDLRDTTADGTERPALVEKHGHSDWYSWATTNWGTKWDICEPYGIKWRTELLGQPDGWAELSFSFDSAWSPPIGAVSEYLDANEDIKIRLSYYEPGCDFMGIWEDFNDDCYQPSEDAPNSESDFWNTQHGKELDEDFNIVETMQNYEEEQKEARG